MKEAEPSELSVTGCTGARATQGRAHGTDEDPKNVISDVEAQWWHFDYRDWRSYRIGNERFDEIGVG